MSGKQQKTQLLLAFSSPIPGEARRAGRGGIEPLMASQASSGPAPVKPVMEEVCEAGNLRKALARVLKNRGGPGVDGMTVEELPVYLKENWPRIREQLLGGTYQPQPVKRVEIPKPDGGTRKLGVPTVCDRFIQQAVLQVLQPRWDGGFSSGSYGFRPGRSAHQAVGQAQRYVAQGLVWVVDLDLEKFFDRVNHDRLMARVAVRVSDPRILRLLRAFLAAGVLQSGLVSPTTEGTPQGGPLSPLLSNLVLDELDKELECRGHRFVRYADDCNIYVGSLRAAQRVMRSVSKFLSVRLRLRVNEQKSAADLARKRSFLGFSFTGGKLPKRRIAPKARERFKERVRDLTNRTRGVSLGRMLKELGEYLRGWLGYFGYCETSSVLEGLGAWIRRRLRCFLWKQWKRGRRRFAELVKRGVGAGLAARTAGSSHGPWRLSASPALSLALPDALFASLGLPKMQVRSAA